MASADDRNLPITRCPHCKTAFRVRETQLALRHGMVRCGACRGVFNAMQHFLQPRGNTILIEPPPDNEEIIYEENPAALNPLTLMQQDRHPKPTPAPPAPAFGPAAPVTATVSAAVPPQAPLIIAASPSPSAAATPDFSMLASLGNAIPAPDPMPMPSVTPNTVTSVERIAPTVAAIESAAVIEKAVVNTPAPTAAPLPTPSAAPTATVSALNTSAANVNPTTTPAPAMEPMVELYTDELEAQLEGSASPTLGPQHFEWKRRAPSSRTHTTLWTIAGLTLLLALVAQSALVFRNEIAVRAPGMRPLLAQLCEPFGCLVTPPERANTLSLDGAEFQADPAHKGLYVFSATMRNRHDQASAFPHLIITLTGLNNQVLSRRIFAPKDYVPGNLDLNAGLTGRGEVEFKLFLDASTISPVGFDVRHTYAPPSVGG
jgi:predicted Zn finger-like uncharacterized protein